MTLFTLGVLFFLVVNSVKGSGCPGDVSWHVDGHQSAMHLVEHLGLMEGVPGL